MGYSFNNFHVYSYFALSDDAIDSDGISDLYDVAYVANKDRPDLPSSKKKMPRAQVSY